MMCCCGHPAAGHYVIRDGGAVIVWNLADGTQAHCGELGCHCRIVARVEDNELPGQLNVYDAIEEW